MRKSSSDPFMFFIILMAAFCLFPSTREHEEKVLVDPTIQRLQPPQAAKVDLSSKKEVVVIRFKIQYEEIYTGVGGTPIFHEGKVKLLKKNIGQNGLPITHLFPPATQIPFRSLGGTSYYLSVPVCKSRVVALFKERDSSLYFLVLAQVKKEGEDNIFVSSRFTTRDEIEKVNAI